MSAQAAGKAIAAGAKAAGKAADGHVLNKGAKRDPELYVCPILAAMPSKTKKRGGDGNGNSIPRSHLSICSAS